MSLRLINQFNKTAKLVLNRRLNESCLKLLTNTSALHQSCPALYGKFKFTQRLSVYFKTLIKC